MYSTCLFCHGDLGENADLERLPVGRLVAFDAARGRLWIVCRRCGRWNLTPFDDRWEAIEACERRFRATTVRTSTDQIGIARLTSGLELVRIGRPLRPEFAAWRYGTRFLQRRRGRPFGLAGSAGLIGLGPLLAATVGPAGPLLVALASGATVVGLLRRPAIAVACGDGAPLLLSHEHIRSAALIREDRHPEGWGLEVDHLDGPREAVTSIRRRRLARGSVVLTGHDARLVATLILPRVNPLGGNAEAVVDAVRWLEAAGGPGTVFRAFAQWHSVHPALTTRQPTLASMHPCARLALEMALHEEEERRALTRELSVLGWVWRRAERVAAIADGLGLPRWVEDAVASIRQGGPADGLPSTNPRETLGTLSPE